MKHYGLQLLVLPALCAVALAANANAALPPAPNASGASPSASASTAAPPSAPTAAPALSLAAVMDKYVSIAGGRALLSKLTSMVAVSSFTLLGHEIVVTTTVKAPSNYLQVVEPEGGAGRLAVGFDGKTAWSQGPDGVVQLLTGQKRAEVIADAAGANNSEIFPNRWPTTVALKPIETIEGKSYYVLSIQAKGGVAHDVLMDSQTFLPVIERKAEPDSSSITIVNEFGKGPLGELISKSATTTSSNLPAITSTMRSLRDNVHVVDSLFAPPLGKGTETI